jgi:hypothetical protein
VGRFLLEKDWFGPWLKLLALHPTRSIKHKHYSL